MAAHVLQCFLLNISENFSRFLPRTWKAKSFSWKMVLHLKFHLELIIPILITDFIAACTAFQFRENK